MHTDGTRGTVGVLKSERVCWCASMLVATKTRKWIPEEGAVSCALPLDSKNKGTALRGCALASTAFLFL